MEPTQYFTNLALAAYVDGQVHPAELALLEKHAENLRLTSEQAQDILNRVATGELKGFVKPKSPKAREAAFRAVVRIIRADSKITGTEIKMIRVIGKSMEIDPTEIEKALQP